MTNTNNPALTALINDVTESIRNEQNYFDMEAYFRPKDGIYISSKLADIDPDTHWCGTQSCMAGHIIASRKELAQKLMPRALCRFSSYVHYGILARLVWEAETGEKCRIDFYTENHSKIHTNFASEITREEAIAHINNTSEVWPLLDDTRCAGRIPSHEGTQTSDL